MSGIITEGYGENQLIVTRGMGYSAIIIVEGMGTQIVRKPKLFYVTREYQVLLQDLQVVSKYSTDIELRPISLAKIRQINMLLSRLQILLPAEVKLLLGDLSILAENTKEIPLDKLKVIKKVMAIKESLEGFNIASLKGQIFILNTANIVKMVENYLDVKFPMPRIVYKVTHFLNSKIPETNIHLLKAKRFLDYLELARLMEEL